ncbi:hypothetical protein LSAT2_017757 [Lamellibrachia satsuma]|nr:hypothetical protein LSAT2_017757 [Lamellibrachia satsuma]
MRMFMSDFTITRRQLPPPPPPPTKISQAEMNSKDADYKTTESTEINTPHNSQSDGYVELVQKRSGGAMSKNAYEEVEGISIAAESIKQKNKLKNIAMELLTTEREYVMKLALLVMFLSRVVGENKKSWMFPDDVIPQMFSNIKTIYEFHHNFLLPQLVQRLKEWESKQKLGDVMKQLAPFLKLTTEYVTNLGHAQNVIREWQVKSPRFASIISSLEFSNVLLVGALKNSKYTLTASLSLDGMQIRGKYTRTMFEVKSKDKVIELLTSSPEETKTWLKSVPGRPVMGQSQVIVKCAREACYGRRGNPSGGSVMNYSDMATFCGRLGMYT